MISGEQAAAAPGAFHRLEHCADNGYGATLTYIHPQMVSEQAAGHLACSAGRRAHVHVQHPPGSCSTAGRGWAAGCGTAGHEGRQTAAGRRGRSTAQGRRGGRAEGEGEQLAKGRGKDVDGCVGAYLQASTLAAGQGCGPGCWLDSRAGHACHARLPWLARCFAGSPARRGSRGSSPPPAGRLAAEGGVDGMSG